MSKSDQAKAREQRLAAKLRENLKRRKGQAKARGQGSEAVGNSGNSSSGKVGKP